MHAEPERVARLQANGRYFLRAARATRGWTPGPRSGPRIVPIIAGSSIRAAARRTALFEEGINVQPIIYPAVPEQAPGCASSSPPPTRRPRCAASPG